MSETVKLIIEMPKEITEYVKNNGCLSVIYIDEIANAIQNGIPLDDVKTEIKRMEYHMIDCEVLVSLDEVLEILDSVGKGDNE